MAHRKQTPGPQKKRSKPEKILIALYQKKNQVAFTIEDIVVISWESDKEALGLKGYTEKFPCSNKVESNVMGARGITKLGWISKNKQTGKYVLTQTGKELAAALLGLPIPTDDGEYQKLPPEKEQFILKMRKHTASQKFYQEEKSTISFSDACQFWDIDEKTKGDALDERLRTTERMIRELASELENQDARLSDGFEVKAGDLRTLGHIHSFMEEKFRHLLKWKREGRRQY